MKNKTNKNSTKKIITEVVSFGIILFILYFGWTFFNNKGTESTSPIISINDESDFTNKIEGTNISNFPDQRDLSGYGIRLFDSNGIHISGRDINYSNNGIDFYVSITNANNYKEKIALVIFLDGKPVKFKVDTKDTEYYSYIHDYSKYALNNIPVTISDTIEDGLHEMYIVALYSADKNPDENNRIRYHTASLRSNLIKGTPKVSKTDISLTKEINIVPLPKDIKSGQGFRAAVDLQDSLIKQVTQKPVIQIKFSNRINMQLQAIAPSGKYSTILFVDYVPVPLYPKGDRLVWNISGNEMLSETFYLDNISLGKHYMFTVTIPLDKQYSLVEGSEKCILDVTE